MTTSVPIPRSMPHIVNYGGFKPYIETQLSPSTVARPMSIVRPSPAEYPQTRSAPGRFATRTATVYSQTFQPRPEHYTGERRQGADFYGTRGASVTRAVRPQTSYQSTFRAPEPQRPQTADNSAILTVSADAKPETIRHTMSLTEYKGGYGEGLGSRPLDRSLTQYRDVSFLATSAPLMVGTTKISHHIPGYTGFIPASDVNPAAVEQGSGRAIRAPPVDKAILRDTFTRGVPGLTTYKPRAASNDRGPSDPTYRTVYGIEYNMSKPVSTRKPLIETNFGVRSANHIVLKS